MVGERFGASVAKLLTRNCRRSTYVNVDIDVNSDLENPRVMTN
jgi:hypothetical protein